MEQAEEQAGSQAGAVCFLSGWFNLLFKGCGASQRLWWESSPFAASIMVWQRAS